MSQDKFNFKLSARMGKLPLWQQLTLLVLITVIPLIILGSLMFNRMVDNERNALRVDLILKARITAALVENEVETHSAIASTLALSPSLQADDLTAFWQEATNALKFVPGAWMAISDPNGQIVLHTLAPPGTVFPPHARYDIIKRGFETQQPQVGDLVMGPVAKKFTAFVEVPVFRGKVPIYSLSISLIPSRFYNLIEKQFNNGEVVAVIDTNKKFIARIPDHEARVGTLSSEGWRTAMTEKPEGWVENTTVEGYKSLTGYTRTSHGWSVGVALLETSISKPFSQILWSGAGLAGALSLASICLAGLIAHNASKGIIALSESARQLAKSSPIPSIQPPFAEAMIIAQSLEQVSNELKRQNDLLLSTNTELEAKVIQRTQDLTSEMKRRESIETTLRQSQKMESIGQLTGGIAHDFNNMLTIVIGNLDTLQRRIIKIDGTETLKRPIEGALQGARSAAKLTHRLLAFSRQQTLQPEALNLNTVVAGISDMLARTMGEAISIETVLGAGLWLTLADANQIENTLVNLAINSRDAMNGCGKLTIETSNTYLDSPYISQFNDLTPGQYVMMSVTDTGCGINSELLNKVFEPFFTTKGPDKGTGLGLAMIYGFVKQSGGHIRLYSEVGEGTSVKIYLPRLTDNSSIIAVPRALPELKTIIPLALNGETILLVEDDSGVLEYALGALEELGYKVVTATSGLEALTKFDDMSRIDLLFTDVVLGGTLNGKQLSKLILEKSPGLPVLFTTGYSRNAIIHQGRLDFGINLLSKPYTLRELAEKLRFVLS